MASQSTVATGIGVISLVKMCIRDSPLRLSEMRAARGLSRLELGRLSGTSHTFVRMTESGTTIPNIAKVEQLAKALQVSVCWLAFGLGNPELPTHRRRRSDEPPAPEPER